MTVSRALSWVAGVFGVLTVAATTWAVVDLSRSHDPTLLVSLVPLLFVNLLLIAIVRSRKKHDSR